MKPRLIHCASVCCLLVGVVLPLFGAVINDPSIWRYRHDSKGIGIPDFGLLFVGDARSSIRQWLLTVILLSLPAAYDLACSLLPLTRRRVPAGCCHACGYDLRATPDRCPECGTLPAAG